MAHGTANLLLTEFLTSGRGVFSSIAEKSWKIVRMHPNQKKIIACILTTGTSVHQSHQSLILVKTRLRSRAVLSFLIIAHIIMEQDIQFDLHCILQKERHIQHDLYYEKRDMYLEVKLYCK